MKEDLLNLRQLIIEMIQNKNTNQNDVSFKNNFICWMMKDALTEEERFTILHSKKVKLEVLEYLLNRFQFLTIKICDQYKGNVLELMKRGLLEGWCWQTTETSIVFLNDDDYIERGFLTFDKDTRYYHSWICFFFDNKEYVFDPSFDLICKKRLYSKIFDTDIKGKVTAKEVRDCLLDCILNPKEDQSFASETVEFTGRFMKKFFRNSFDHQKEEAYITGDDCVHSPMYRNYASYQADIQDNKIKKLVAHFYCHM